MLRDDNILVFYSKYTGLVLVSDGMAAMGLGDGEHHIGQMMVKVQGRRAVLAGTNTLAGSVATMDECVRVFINDAGMYKCLLGDIDMTV